MGRGGSAPSHKARGTSRALLVARGVAASAGILLTAGVSWWHLGTDGGSRFYAAYLAAGLDSRYVKAMAPD